MTGQLRALAVAALVAWPAPSRAAGPVPGDAGRAEPALPADLPALDAPPRPVAEVEPKPLPDVARPRAVARFEGTPAPGARIKLSGGNSTGQALRFRWVQTAGPRVALDDPEGRTASFTVPEGSGALGFVLVAANGTGVDSAPVTVPVEPRPHGEAAPSWLRADAGDDVLGLVGRQVTLNGARSEPRGKIGYRWIQVGGPTVKLKLEDGYIFSFVPTAPGVYRFGLVVASGGEISQPDTVSVSVGAPTAALAAPAPEAVDPPSVAEMARAALASIPGGTAASGPMADAFAGVADRMDLYRSYADVFLELTRRLERILPADPARRAAWDERLFLPMTGLLIRGLCAEGLDLRQPDAQRAELTAGQRARLAEQFREMAEGFRAAMPAN